MVVIIMSCTHAHSSLPNDAISCPAAKGANGSPMVSALVYLNSTQTSEPAHNRSLQGTDG